MGIPMGRERDGFIPGGAAPMFGLLELLLLLRRLACPGGLVFVMVQLWLSGPAIVCVGCVADRYCARFPRLA